MQKDDVIYRQAAIDAIRASTKKYTGFMEMEMYTDDDAVEAIEALPSAQPDLNEWCVDCKEYDAEKHHCPRFNRVIREALKDAEPEIIRCKDCKHRFVDGDNVRFNVCELNHNKVQGDDWYCADAERKL